MTRYLVFGIGWRRDAWNLYGMPKPSKTEPNPYRLPLDGSMHQSLEEQLIDLLIYYRFYTTHLFIGSLFGVDDSTICRRFAVLEPLVVGAVAIKKDRTRRQDNLETLLIDATEQPIERPVRGQRRFYSGKKKRHTLRTEVQVTEAGHIVAISKPFPGAVHDIEVRRRGPPLSAWSRAYVGSGYQGLQKHHAQTELPYKR